MLTHVRGEQDDHQAVAPTTPAAVSSPRSAAAVSSAARFDEFYAACAPRLVRQLHAMTGDLTEAQDCVQEACARAWQRWDRLAGYDAPEAWVRQVAWRLAVSRFRRARSGVSALRRHGPTPDVAAAGPDHVDLVAALARIPAAQRRAVVLHHVAGLSVREVAAETGAPEGTVKARLSRGRAALALLLSGDPEAPRAGRGPVPARPVVGADAAPDADRRPHLGRRADAAAARLADPRAGARAERPGWAVVTEEDPGGGPLFDPCGDGGVRTVDPVSGDFRALASVREAGGSRLIQSVAQYAEASQAGTAFEDHAAAVARCPESATCQRTRRVH